MYVIHTRYVTAKGQIVRHVYGTWPTRAKAQTVLKNMMKDTERTHTAAEIARSEGHVVKLLDSSEW